MAAHRRGRLVRGESMSALQSGLCVRDPESASVQLGAPLTQVRRRADPQCEFHHVDSVAPDCGRYYNASTAPFALCATTEANAADGSERAVLARLRRL